MEDALPPPEPPKVPPSGEQRQHFFDGVLAVLCGGLWGLNGIAAVYRRDDDLMWVSALFAAWSVVAFVSALCDLVNER